jgi:DNA-binding protein HU-beta
LQLEASPSSHICFSAYFFAISPVVKDSLAHGENVYLRGFGTFQVKERAEKTARNISKNTTIVIPAHNIPFFKPSAEFKKEVAL